MRTYTAVGWNQGYLILEHVKAWLFAPKWVVMVVSLYLIGDIAAGIKSNVVNAIRHIDKHE